MNKLDLALNILQWLICHKTKPNQTNQIRLNREKVLVFYSSAIINIGLFAYLVQFSVSPYLPQLVFKMFDCNQQIT